MRIRAINIPEPIDTSGPTAGTGTSGSFVWILAREHLTLEKIVASERMLRQEIEQHTLRSWAIAFVLYTLVSLVPGTSGKSIVLGWLFGLWAGTALVTVTLVIAASIEFLVCRYVLGDWIRTRFAMRMRSLDRHIHQDGAFYMLTLRMLHVPYTLVNATAGASGMKLWTFACTTWVGLIPGSLIFVGLGSTLPTLDELLEQGVDGIVRPELFAALLLTGVVPWGIRALYRRFRSDLADDPFEDPPEVPV